MENKFYDFVKKEILYNLLSVNKKCPGFSFKTRGVRNEINSSVFS